MPDDRTRRIGKTEHVFRTINDRIEGLSDSFALVSDEVPVVCECGDPVCVEKLTVDRDRYRALRADATLFVIAPGHEAADVEAVVEKGDRYWVVRKRPGAPAEQAAALAD